MMEGGGNGLDFNDLIEQRYSVRSYKSDAVEPEKLQKILEAGRLAPTAANRQAIRILVIKTEKRREELKSIYERDWFTQAPLIIGVCSIPGETWVRKDNKNYSDVDAAIVMDHMILMATALGLGTCWIAAFDAPAAKRMLKLEDGLEPVVLSPVGYARDHLGNKTRKPLNDLVIYR